MDGLRPVTINNVAVNLPILNLQIEDSAFALYSCFKNLLHRPTGYADAFSSDPTAPIYDSREVMAGRILINNLIIGKLQALADIHLSTAKTGLPVAVDTNRYETIAIPTINQRGPRPIFLPLQPCAVQVPFIYSADCSSPDSLITSNFVECTDIVCHGRSPSQCASSPWLLAIILQPNGVSPVH